MPERKTQKYNLVARTAFALGDVGFSTGEVIATLQLPEVFHAKNFEMALRNQQVVLEKAKPEVKPPLGK